MLVKPNLREFSIVGIPRDPIFVDDSAAAEHVPRCQKVLPFAGLEEVHQLGPASPEGNLDGHADHAYGSAYGGCVVGASKLEEFRAPHASEVYPADLATLTAIPADPEFPDGNLESFD